MQHIQYFLIISISHFTEFYWTIQSSSKTPNIQITKRQSTKLPNVLSTKDDFGSKPLKSGRKRQYLPLHKTKCAIFFAISLKGLGFDQTLIINRVVETITWWDKFSMRRNIKLYNFDLITHNRETLHMGSITAIFDKILLQHYDKHPLLQQVIFQMCDDYYLFGLARLLLYFNQNFKQLFMRRKLYLKHFKKIKIHFHHVITRRGDVDTNIRQPTANMIADNAIFAQNSNQEYPVDENVIEIKQVKEGIESFGIIFRNVLNWLRARQEKFSSIRDCQIVFN